MKPPRNQVSRGANGPLSPQGTRPDGPDTPSGLQQLRPSSIVPCHVGFELGSPQLRVSGRGSRVTASRMPVPETAMHEDGSPVLGQYQIGAPGEARRVQAVSEAQCVQRPPESQFRLRVLPANSRHHPGPRQLVDSVGHLPLGLRPFNRYTTIDLSSRDT